MKNEWIGLLSGSDHTPTIRQGLCKNVMIIARQQLHVTYGTVDASL